MMMMIYIRILLVHKALFERIFMANLLLLLLLLLLSWLYY
jgi:hypothetical protein